MGGPRGAVLAGLAICCATAGCAPAPAGPLTTDPERGEIAFPGTIYPGRYNRHPDRAAGHHFIVWSGGGAADQALINTDVSDREILAALERIGAVPGDNLTADTWTARDDPTATAPDRRVEGTPVRVHVGWDGEERPAWRLFRGARESDLDLRVGGHVHLIPRWRSGCVACLFSCPGGRTSNAAFTIREQVQDRKVFLADSSSLPADGTAVRVRVAIGASSPAATRAP